MFDTFVTTLTEKLIPNLNQLSKRVLCCKMVHSVVTIPWYKRDKWKFSILLILSIVVFVTVYAIVKHEMSDAPTLYMTTHNYTNIVMFNGDNGDLTGASFLDMTNFSHLTQKNDVRFRGIILVNGHILVVNAHYKHSFVAKFVCCNLIDHDNNSQSYQTCLRHSQNKNKNKNGGIPFDSIVIEYSYDKNWGLVHPYGIAHHTAYGYYFITTQDTHSVLGYDSRGNPLSLPGMQLHYPGGVITIKHNDDNNDDSRDDDTIKDKISRHSKGVRGLCIDESMNLLFIASEFTHNIIVLNIDKSFSNVYNISLPRKEDFQKLEPIAVMIGAPYHNNTLFVSDKANKKVFAFKVHANNYQFFWESSDTRHLSHPSGIGVADDVIYVLSEGKNRVLLFSPHTGQYLDTLVHFRYDGAGHSSEGTIVENIHHKTVDLKNWHISGEQMLFIKDGGCTPDL